MWWSDLVGRDVFEQKPHPSTAEGWGTPLNLRVMDVGSSGEIYGPEAGGGAEEFEAY